MANEFLRTVGGVNIRKAEKRDVAELTAGPEKGRMVRLYCTQHGEAWQLQVRGPLSVGGGFSGRDGQDFVIAGAKLYRDDLIALRDALTEHLKEV